jgi:hypothetical protein
MIGNKKEWCPRRGKADDPGFARFIEISPFGQIRKYEFKANLKKDFKIKTLCEIFIILKKETLFRLILDSGANCSTTFWSHCLPERTMN